MSETKIIREITTITRRRIELEDIEQALRDQFDIHVQDDHRFEWDVSQDFVRGVELVHTEREVKEG